MNNKEFEIYHWKFFEDNHGVTTIFVYEEIDGNVVGYLRDINFNDLELLFSSKEFIENEVYNWINDNIEYL